MKIYGDHISANCHKITYTADYLGLPYEWIDVDILNAGSRTPEFLAMNPVGQVPTVQFKSGDCLAQSNAVMLYIADGSKLIPKDKFQRAKMLEWLFWEQYNHEPSIAVCRTQLKHKGKTPEQLDQTKVSKGNDALDLMEKHLTTRDWFVGDHISLADIALVAYTRLAHEGGFDLSTRPSVLQWIARTEHALNITTS